MRINMYSVFVSVLLLSVFISCNKNPLAEIDSQSVLSIVLVETNVTYFTDSDFEGYRSSSCEIVLNKAGINKWNSYIFFDSLFNPPVPKLGNHYQKEFAVKIDGNEIYHGIFTSDVSSMMFNCIVEKDILMKKDTLQNRFQIEIQSIDSNSVPDLRNDERIIRLFQIKNKLID